MTITLGQALEVIKQGIKDSPLGADTVLVLSLTGSELEDVDVHSLCLVKDDDGAVMQVRVIHPHLTDEEMTRELVFTMDGEFGQKEMDILGHMLNEPVYDFNETTITFYIPEEKYDAVRKIVTNRMSNRALPKVKSVAFNELKQI